MGRGVRASLRSSFVRVWGQARVEGFPIKRHGQVAYPPGKKLSVIAQAFLEYLEQALTPMQALPRLRLHQTRVLPFARVDGQAPAAFHLVQPALSEYIFAAVA